MSMPHTQTSKDIKYNAHKQMSGPTSTKSARAEPHEYAAAYTNVGSNTETKARQGRARHGIANVVGIEFKFRGVLETRGCREVEFVSC